MAPISVCVYIGLILYYLNVKANNDFVVAKALRIHMNDRPYVASSFLSVAMSGVFGTAMSGKSKDRPELANKVLPFDKNHLWHMDNIAKYLSQGNNFIMETNHILVDVTDSESVANGIGWWENLTSA